MWQIRKIKQQQQQQQQQQQKNNNNNKTPKRNSQRQKQEQKTKHKNETHSMFPNNFSHVVYLFPHQKLLSAIHLRYWNHVIC